MHSAHWLSADKQTNLHSLKSRREKHQNGSNIEKSPTPGWNGTNKNAIEIRQENGCSLHKASKNYKWYRDGINDKNGKWVKMTQRSWTTIGQWIWNQFQFNSTYGQKHLHHIISINNNNNTHKMSITHSTSHDQSAKMENAKQKAIQHWNSEEMEQDIDSSRHKNNGHQSVHTLSLFPSDTLSTANNMDKNRNQKRGETDTTKSLTASYWRCSSIIDLMYTVTHSPHRLNWNESIIISANMQWINTVLNPLQTPSSDSIPLFISPSKQLPTLSSGKTQSFCIISPRCLCWRIRCLTFEFGH